MTRLGELLIEAGLLTNDQLSEALRAQVMRGGRLGTSVSELGFLDLDTLSRVLGWQHSLPAALARHFDHADAQLQKSLSGDLAEHCGCVPLLRAGKRVVVASMAPLGDRALEVVGSELKIAPELVVVSVAAELRIFYQLEHVYGILRPHRFLRVRGTEVSPRSAMPRAEVIAKIPSSPSDLDELDFEHATPLRAASGSERRRYLPTLGDGGVVEPYVSPAEVQEVPRLAATSVDTSLHAIRCALDRADVAELTIEAVSDLVPRCRAAALLIVRGQAATSWTSFCRGGVVLNAIAVSLDRPGLPRVVVQRTSTVRAASGDLTENDYLLLTALAQSQGDLLLIPIRVGTDIVGMLVAAMESDAAVDALEQIAEAASMAFARLVRDASGPTRTGR